MKGLCTVSSFGFITANLSRTVVDARPSDARYQASHKYKCAPQACNFQFKHTSLLHDMSSQFIGTVCSGRLSVLHAYLVKDPRLAANTIPKQKT
jgi:hypothetical protein